jgi:hypothetical protein
MFEVVEYKINLGTYIKLVRMSNGFYPDNLIVHSFTFESWRLESTSEPSPGTFEVGAFVD